MSDEILDLSDEQKDFILMNWDKMDLIQLTRKISNNPEADGRDKIGRAVREFIASKGLEIKTTKFQKKGEIILSKDQVEFVLNNIDKMKLLELTRLLFKVATLAPLSREYRAVYAYAKTLDKVNIIKEEEEPADEEYDSPKSIYKVVHRVNRFVQNPKDENALLFNTDPKQLSTSETKQLRALLGNMNLLRFVHQMKRYTKAMDRELFESSFIGMTWDKPDLLREEVEQYISLSGEIVQTAQLDRNIQKMDDAIDEAWSGDSDKKISMTMIENINSLREKLNKSKDEQRKLIANLSGSRSERLKKKVEANASILNLVEAFQNEKKRLEMIELAEMQKKAEEEDIGKLSSMEDIVAIIAGLSKDEALN